MTVSQDNAGELNNRLSHCSRRSWRSSSNGSKFDNSTVFGVRPSIMAPTAKDNLRTTGLFKFGRT